MWTTNHDHGDQVKLLTDQPLPHVIVSLMAGGLPIRSRLFPWLVLGTVRLTALLALDVL